MKHKVSIISAIAVAVLLAASLTALIPEDNEEEMTLGAITFIQPVYNNGITGVPGTAIVGEPLTLTDNITISPSSATYKDIVWSVVSAGSTGATISGNVLTAPNTGTVQVRATIEQGLSDVVMISAGSKHTVAIDSDGYLWAWGDNQYGQLGDGTTINKDLPVKIGTDKWSDASAGGNHTVAIKADGSLWTWGYNFYGQLGDGTNGNGTNKNTPVRIGTANDWTSVSAGGNHSLGIRGGGYYGGDLYGWGDNYYGQLGDGTNTNRNVPTRNILGDPWIHVSAGANHTVALIKGGDDQGSAYFGWGDNQYGQLGDGTYQDRNWPTAIVLNWSPYEILELSNVLAGANHTVAIDMEGYLLTWGRNQYGQLGDGYTNNRNRPYSLPGSGWDYISAGDNHNIAIHRYNGIFAWGHNQYYQLGDGTNSNRYSPIGLPYGTPAMSLSAGGTTTVAGGWDGSLYAWGDGTSYMGVMGSPAYTQNFNIDVSHPTVTVTGSNVRSSDPETVPLNTSNVTVKVLPAPGYRISGINSVTMKGVLLTPGAGYTVNADDTITISQITGSVIIAATATAIDYDITVTGGTASPTSGTIGTEVTLTPNAPASGMHLLRWNVIAGGVTVTDNKFNIGTANVEIEAVWSYDVTVNVKKDTLPYDVTTVTLVGDDTHVLTRNAIGTYASAVPQGTYEVWVDGKNTGVSVEVGTGKANEAMVDFYTLTLNKDIGVTSVSEGGIFLAGTEDIDISAVLKDHYDWAKWVAESTGTFADVLTKDTTITMPAYALTLTATATDTLYTVTIDLKKDDAAWKGQTVTLNNGAYLLSDAINDGVYVSLVVPHGTYDIFVNTEDTGKTITVGSGVNKETLDFYTLTLVAGTGVASVSEGGIFLAGTEDIEISAVLKDHYDWAKWVAESTGTFADVLTKDTTITMPAYALTLTATTTDTLYTVTIDLKKDDAAWKGQTVTLDGVYTLSDSDGGYVSLVVPHGTYDIFVNTEDTGETITVGSGVNKETLNFYTLTLVDGTGVASVSEGGIFLAGTEDIEISAVLKDHYDWAKWVAESTGTFADVLTKDTTITMPGYTLKLTATTTDTLYTVTIDLKKDDAAWKGQTVTLDGVYTLSDSDGGYVSLVVPHGTYDIFVNTEDTGETITVGSGVNKETLNFYTLALTKDTGVESVAGGGIFLFGSTVEISAVLANEFTWVEWVADPAKFGNVALDDTTIMMPDYPLTLKATATVTTYMVEITLNKDDALWKGETVILKDGAHELFDDDDGVYVSEVPKGTYTIWLGERNTGATITVGSGESNVKTLDFYTLTLTKDAGVESVAGGGIFLFGSTVEISAVLANEFTWDKWIASTGPSDNVSARNTTIVMPAYVLTLTATANVTLYDITINVKKDNLPYDVTTVTLVGDDTHVLTRNAIGTYASAVPQGTYEVWVDGKDTGIEVTAEFEGTNAATVNFYTLTLVAGTGVASVSEGGIFLAGTEDIEISAVLKDHYDWAKWVAESTGTFADVSVKNTTITMPGYALKLTATATDTLYTVTIDLKKDDAAWKGQTVTLDGVYTLLDSDGGYVSLVVPHGTYDIFVNTEDTGKTITVGSGVNKETLDFYTLTLVAGTGVASVSEGGIFLAGTEDIDISAVLKDHYDWAKWVAESTGTFADVLTKDTTITMPAYALTLTATATDTLYEVTVNVNKDAMPWDGMIVKLNDTYLLTDNDDGVYVSEVPQGVHTIWVDGKDTGVTVEVGSGKANEETLSFFTLTLNKDPGVESVAVGGVFLAGTKDIDISAELKDNYTWVEWVAAPATFGDVSIRNTTITMPGYALTLTATTTDTLYTVAVDGGTATPSSGAAGTQVTLAPGEAPDDRYFKEWNVTEAGGGSISGNVFTIGNANAEIEAVWETLPVNTYSVTVSGGTASPTYGPTGTVVTLTPGAAPIGKEFGGWSVTSGGVTVADNKFMIGNANVVIEAVWDTISLNTYSVTVIGGTSAPKTHGYTDDKLTLTPGAAPAGKEFVEWKVIVSGGGYLTGDVFTIGTANAVIEAVWDFETYTVTVNGGTATPSSGIMGTQVTLAPGTAPAGQYFNGWTVTADGGGSIAGNVFTIGTANAIITAEWEDLPVNTYSVTVSGGTASPTYGLKGAEVTLTPGAAPAGKEFKEWKVISGGVTIEDGKFTIGNANVVIEAVWDTIPLNTYSITVIGGTAEPETYGHTDDELTLTLGETPAGKEFVGWKVLVSGGGYLAGDVFTIGTANAVIEAVLVDIIYDISVEGGTASLASGIMGTKAELTPASPEPGMKFKEWIVTDGEGTLSGNVFTIGTTDATITATWEEVPLGTYSVTVVGGTSAPTYGETGAKVTLIPGVAPEGKEFTGWRIVSGGGSISGDVFTIGTENAEIEALWGTIPANTYSVTVSGGTADPTHGTTGTEVELEHGTAPIGKEFGGWKVIVSGGGSLEGDTFTIGTANAKIEVIWTDVIYNISVTGGIATPSSGIMGTEVRLIPGSPAPGERFKEWEVVSDNVDVIDGKFTIGTEDVVIIAKWEEVPLGTYSVTVIGGTSAPTYGPEDTEVILIPGAAPAGHEFDRWSVTISGGGELDGNIFTIGDANATITAIWKPIPPNTYSVTVFGGTADPTYGVTGKYVELTPGDAPAGKAFGGWDVIVSGGGSIDGNVFTIGDANAMIEAVWENLYTVTVIRGVASAPSGTTGTEVELTPLGIPNGQRLRDWTVTTSEGTYTLSGNSFTIGTENVTITANWEYIPYTVTVEGGTASPAYGRIGTSVEIEYTEQPGKEFDRWVVKEGDVILADAASEITTFTIGTANVVIEALWTDIIYTISVTGGEPSEGSGIMDDLITITLTDDPPEIWMKFGGWEVKAGGVTLADAASEITTFTIGTANVEIAAIWVDIEYTVTVIGGTSSEPFGVKDEEITITLTADPPEIWMKFGGWEVKAGGVTLADVASEITTFTIGTANVVIEALWTDIIYTISVTGGTSSEPFGVKDEEITITLTDDPPEIWMKFGGWSVTSGGVTLADVASEITTFTIGIANVEIAAIWVDIEYTVTVTGGTSSEPFGVKDEEMTITLTADPPEPGTEFVGWEVKAGGVTLASATSEITTFTIGTADVVIEAVWDYIIYDVSVKDGMASPDSGKIGTEVTLAPILENAPEGTQFAGWIVISGDVEVIGGKFTIGTEDVSIEAVWVNVYTVTVEGGTSAPAYGPTGTLVTLTIGTAPEGMQFLGWDAAGSGGGSISGNVFTIGTANATIEAIWGIVTITTSSPGFTKGMPEPENFVMTVNVDRDLFSHVMLNNELLDEEHYVVTSGSTIITMSPTYLEGLGPGDYDVDVVFTHTTVSTIMTILGATAGDEPDDEPGVGDDTGSNGGGFNMMILVIIAIAAIAAVGAVAYFMFMKKPETPKGPETPKETETPAEPEVSEGPEMPKDGE